MAPGVTFNLRFEQTEKNHPLDCYAAALILSRNRQRHILQTILARACQALNDRTNCIAVYDEHDAVCLF
ncbi:hypothetical protein FYB92_15205 [Novacetimonas sp. GS1]